MLKAKGTMPDGSKVLLLGLSRGNLERFLAEMGDTYIRISSAEVGITAEGAPIDIIIFSGVSEREMYLKMRGNLSADAVIHMTDRLKEQL